MLPPGTYSFGPQQATMRVFTGRDGMARKVGHDLVLEVTNWTATIEVDGDDLARSTATASIDPSSFRVLDGSGGAKPLSDGDRADIVKNIRDKILRTNAFPQITFQSRSVENGADGTLTLLGDLTIVGATRPIRLQVTSDGGKRADATATIVQSEWGIKPFTALMGALKVRDSVEVRIETDLPTA